MKTHLSKSRYTKFCQCPKALWLSINKKDEAKKDADLEARFAEGNIVGDLAMGIFGEYVDVTTFTSEGNLNLSEMIRKTNELMADENCNVVCEASFSFTNVEQTNYCAVDILRREKGGWAIYEVKSTTSSKLSNLEDKKFVDKVGKYAIDIAFQKWVLEKCGVKVTGTYLVTLSSDYRLNGEYVIEELFNTIDMSPLVANEYLKVSKISSNAHKVLQQELEPNNTIGIHCTTPYQCLFWEYCTRQANIDLENNKATVFDLYNLSTKKKFEYFAKGKISFENIKHEKLNDRQRTQVDCTLGGYNYINKEGIKEFLGKVTYPLYFLDFESMQTVLPKWDGTRPYQQVCFQYSLHYIEQEGGELKHKAFLAPSDGTDPRRALAEALCGDIQKDACIMAYNDPFERTRIKEMAEEYDDLAPHLNNIKDNIIDLLSPFSKGYCYIPAMGSSFSIKSVLPALFPNNEELNYQNLDTLVQNGGQAMTVFPKLKDMSVDEALKARQALLDYCHLDTLAMVRVWKKLKELSEE